MEESCHQKSDRQINLEIILTRTSKQPGANKKVTVRGSAHRQKSVVAKKGSTLLPEADSVFHVRDQFLSDQVVK